MSSENITKADWYLRRLIRFLNETDLTVTITLNVGGFLVCGRIISEKHYFEGIDRFIRAGFQQAGIESLEGYEDIYTRADGEDQQTALEPEYIHLEDAQMFHPAGLPVPSERGVLWRGRLDAVEGFSFANLTASVTRVRP